MTVAMCLQSAAESVTTPEAFAKEYPFLFEIAQQLAGSCYEYDADFAFGLELVLDGSNGSSNTRRVHDWKFERGRDRRRDRG